MKTDNGIVFLDPETLRNMQTKSRKNFCKYRIFRILGQKRTINGHFRVKIVKNLIITDFVDW